MNFFVQIEGDSAKPCRTADDAITYAKTRVYLSTADEIRVRADLQNGQTAQYAYGFKSVQIIPRSGKTP